MTAAALLTCISSASAAGLTKLRCEYLTDPLGIDVEHPRLSWVLEEQDSKPEVRAQRQTGYQIVVASTPELLEKNQGDCWDSGKVASDQTAQIEYAGKPLASRQRCFWKVGVFLDSPAAVKQVIWSKPACWEMGLLKAADWQAKWIDATGYSDANTQPPPVSLTIVKAVYG